MMDCKKKHYPALNSRSSSRTISTVRKIITLKGVVVKVVELRLGFSKVHSESLIPGAPAGAHV